METFLSQYGEVTIPDDCVHGVWLDKPCPDCVDDMQDEGMRLVGVIIPMDNYKPEVVEENGTN